MDRVCAKVNLPQVGWVAIHDAAKEDDLELMINIVEGKRGMPMRGIDMPTETGLTPLHVSALFLAEASVFATIGAVMGYLVGQTLAISLASFGMLEGITLNYSSLSAISSTLIVMITVFLSTMYPAKKAADMTVPDDRLADLYRLYSETLGASGLEHAVFGHVGNSHFHVNILPKTDEEFEAARHLYREFGPKIVAMGGAIAGEHGLGRIKRDFLRYQYGPEQLEALLRVKRFFDPRARLNPGVLLPSR